MYTIRQISKQFSLPPSTLRYYEEMGILSHIQRDEHHQRIYELHHVHRLQSICCFKRTGMSIRQLQQFFAYEEAQDGSIQDILTLFETQKSSLEAQKEQLEKDYAHIKRKLAFYKDIASSIASNSDAPSWENYKDKEF